MTPIKSIDILPSVQTKREKTDDLISRQDAIRLAEQGQIQGFEWQFKKLCELPPAEPERKLELHGDESTIEILSELRSWFSCFDEKEDLAYHALSLAIKEIKANSVANPEPQWISASKEHPPRYQDIWITDIYGGVKVVYRGNGRLWLCNGDNGYVEDEIIAWTPANVPEPYQPKEEQL